MSPAAATATATATTAGADGAALKGGSAKGKAQRDDRLLEMRLGTWNVQALGWGLLQMLLGMSCLDADGAEYEICDEGFSDPIADSTWPKAGGAGATAPPRLFPPARSGTATAIK